MNSHYPFRTSPILFTLLICCLTACSQKPPAPETPQTAFKQMRDAARNNDFKTVFDRCDDKGQSLLLEVAYGLFTMELWERYQFGSKDTAAIQQAFTKELGLDPDTLEASDRDATSRKTALLLMIKTSKGPMRDGINEMLQNFARLQFSSVEMLDDNNARITLVADDIPRTGYMTLQDGRWLLVSGLSFPGGQPPAAK